MQNNRERVNATHRVAGFGGGMKLMINKFSKFVFVLVILGGSFLFANTSSAATLYWYGGSGNWSSATGHWSTNSGNSPAADHIAPVAADTVIFDANSSASDYTVTIDTAAVSAGGTIGAPASGNLTITTDTTKTRSLTLGGNVTIAGSPNIGGNSDANRLLISSDTSGTPRVFYGTQPTFSNVDFSDISTINRHVVAMGDSITNSGSSYLQKSFSATTKDGWVVMNKGIGGNTTSQMLARFSTDVLADTEAKYVVIQGGINDISVPNTVMSNLQSMYTQAHDAGLTVVAVTLTPFEGATLWSSTNQTNAEQINDWIKTSATNVDYVVDLYPSFVDPENPNALLPAYDSGDHLHLSADGYSLRASLIYSAIASWTGVDTWDLSAISGGSGNLGGNAGINFTTPTDQYFYKASGNDNWSTTANWFTDQGHTVPGRVPLPQDTAKFINGFGSASSVLTLDMPRIGSVDWTNVNNSPTWALGNNINCYGSVTLSSAMSFTGSYTFNFNGRGDYYIDGNSKSFPRGVKLNAYGGSLDIVSPLSTYQNSVLTINDGTLTNSSNSQVSLGGIYIGKLTVYQKPRADLGTALYILRSYNANVSYVLYIEASTMLSSLATFKITDTTDNLKTVAGASGNLWIDIGAGAGNVLINGGNISTFTDTGTASHTIKFTKGTVATIGTWDVNGDATHTITLDTNDGAGTFTLLKSGGGFVSADYLSINRSAATPESSWYAGSHSTDNGTNSGWIFTSPPPQDPPQAPTAGVPTVLSTSSIRWNFTDNSSDETGFSIYDDTNTLVISSTTVDLTYLDETGLLENTKYSGRYAVAYNNYGNSASSSAVTEIYTLVDTPTNLSASSDSNNITLTVDSFPNDTSEQSGYYFSRSDGENSGWIQTNLWTDTGLSCGHSYDYSVIYRNGDGTETSPISITKSTGGCSGGGRSSSVRKLPITPSGGFKININGGASTTSNRNVILGFNARSNIKKIAISMTGDFTDASQVDYVAFKQWDLCSKLGGLVKNSTCPDGKYTVYTRFYTAYGKTTGNAFASSTIVLKSDTITTENFQPNQLTVLESFAKQLKPNQIDEDVKKLQIFLNSDPDTKITNSGAGSPGNETNYFGTLTKNSVIKFQEKYAKDILVPWGFEKGTGIVGKTTLLKINELIKNEFN